MASMNAQEWSECEAVPPLRILFHWYFDAWSMLCTMSMSHCYLAALMNEREPRYLSLAEWQVYVGVLNFLQLPEVLISFLNLWM
jgi:hypothetical protein